MATLSAIFEFRVLCLFFLSAVVGIGTAIAQNKSEMNSFVFEGEVDIAPELMGEISKGDRLILKLFHPADGIEMDTKYSIVSDFILPLKFRISPSIVMDGGARHETYMIEVFTDKDQDVLRVAPGEVYGTTPDTLQVGTQGIRIVLRHIRESKH